MKGFRVSKISVALFIVMAVLILATRRDFGERNAEIFTEMVYSPSYRAFEDNPVFPNGRTLQDPVRGTIPRGFSPFEYSESAASMQRAGERLTNPVPPSLEAFARGRQVYDNFCLHCHGAEGKGDGGVAKVATAFAMSIVGKATMDLPDGSLFHIITKGRNNMPPHASQITQEDRWKLIHHVRELQRTEHAKLLAMGIDFEVDPRPHSLISKEYGRELYMQNCGSCHGAEGLNPNKGVPTLNIDRVLAVADDDFYTDIINHGRAGTEMPGWSEILTPTQTESIVKYIRSWLPDVTDRAMAKVQRGSTFRGRAIYRGNCLGCHGGAGQGGLGSALSAPSFLAMASDEFLRDTIIAGRKHTGMPAGYSFSADDISDLLAYFRRWSTPKSSFAEFRKLRGEAGTRNERIGKKIFRARCASCHGKNGEGGIGSTLNSESFLALADDTFLYRSIVEGRPGTAMPNWHFLTSEDVSDVVTYMRTWQKQPPNLPPARTGPGRPEFGKVIFDQACISCHGREGRGDIGNQIANHSFLDNAKDEFLWNTIAYGKDGTAMRAFLRGAPGGSLMPLEPSDINHIIAYLRHIQSRPKVIPPRRPRTETSLALGREIYEKKGGCAGCHGMEGEGATGPALGGADFLQVASDGFILGTLALGRENTEMLSYYRGGNVNLTQEEMLNVTAYVRSFEDHPPKRRSQIDLSPATVRQGKELYTAHCAGCHGSNGLGPRDNPIKGWAPSLNSQEFLRAADDGMLLATIALGRPGTAMLSFAKGTGGISDLTADEIRKIVSFIRSWEKEEE